ncbi:MAG: hypothetical protein R2991_07320 [Thermoanaerobaculia bacterium]
MKVWMKWVVAAALVLALAVWIWKMFAWIDPPLDSAIAAHGNTDWHIDTANEFLFGTDMGGTATAANHAPAGWTRDHIHVGSTNTAHFYFDDDRTSPGDDDDATDGIDRQMLFFYAGHGNPTGWNTLGNNGTQSSVLLGDVARSLRYYWQCSCEVFAHGPQTCPGESLVYACPQSFDGSSDSSSMRNVYERWGPALGDDLRMACGVSTDAWCHEGNVNRIWDNYNNKGFDVADSFIQGLAGGTDAVPLCITTGGFSAGSTPLYDSVFTNARNPSGAYLHIQYLDGFDSTAPDIFGPIPEYLPELELVPLPLPDPWRAYGLQEVDGVLVSREQVEGRGPRFRVQPASGALYVRGERKVEAGQPLAEAEYLDAARRVAAEQGWSEESSGTPQGSRMMLATAQRRTGKPEGEPAQKDVLVTIRRVLDLDGVRAPVLGPGGAITVQLNNDGTVLNAAKVWRTIAAHGAMLPVKPYEAALEEAIAELGEARQSYRLLAWQWGYEEEAGNVEQRTMRMVYLFDFTPRSPEDVLDHPLRRVRVEGQVG